MFYAGLSMLVSAQKYRIGLGLWPRRVLFCLAALCLLASPVACGPSGAVDGQTRRFAQKVRSELERLGALVTPAMAKGDHGGAARALDRGYQKGLTPGLKPARAAVILDAKAVYLHGAYNDQAQHQNEAREAGANYGNYQIMRRVMEHRQISQGEMHTVGMRYVAVCTPLLKNRRELCGILCLGFSPERFQGDQAPDVSQFLSLNLNR